MARLASVSHQTVSRVLNGHPSIRDTTRYLLEQAHQRILHLAGPPDRNDAQERLGAYEAEMRAAGLTPLPPVFGDWTSDSGFEAGQAVIRNAGRATELPFSAVFAAKDQMALGLTHALRQAGLDIPRDVSVAGFDDIPESAHSCRR